MRLKLLATLMAVGFAAGTAQAVVTQKMIDNMPPKPRMFFPGVWALRVSASRHSNRSTPKALKNWCLRGASPLVERNNADRNHNP